MYNVQLVRIQNHRRSFKRINVSLMLQNLATGASATSRGNDIEGIECFNGAENTTEENES